MLLSLFIILVLMYSIYIGVKRGFILQLFMSIGFFFAYWFASSLHEPLSHYVELIVPYPTPALMEESPFALYGIERLFDLHTPFYKGVSFLILLFIGWIIVRLLGRLFNFASDISVSETIRNVGGAIFSFFCHYVGLFVILFVVSTLPFNFVQNQIESSFLSRMIITKTPELSKDLYNRWVEHQDTEAEPISPQP